MSKIKLLAVVPDSHGVGKYRIMDPYKFIGDNYNNEIHVDITHNAENKDEFFKDYNIVVFHTFIHQSTHQENLERIKWLKDKGIKVIMDIDDLWFVDSRHPMNHQIRIGKIGEKKVEFLKLADYVTTTTSIFQSTLIERLKLKNVLVFPNAIDPNEKQFQPNPIKSEKIRFGWLGGSSHLHDINLLTNGISSTFWSNQQKVQFVLCGFDTRGHFTEMNKDTGEIKQVPIQPKQTVWYEYEKIFTDNFKMVDPEYFNYLETFTKSDFNDSNKSYVRKWTENISTYANNYNYFDVSLSPLVESVFNSNKSQLKIIEAGFHKKAVIASNVKPYTIDLISAYDNGKFIDNGNALLVEPNKNHKQWQKHMKKLVENPEMIKDLGERLYDTVKYTYSQQKVCKDRVEFLKSII